MQDEMWKPIAGYEGKYEVSSHGRIKNLPFDYISGMHKLTKSVPEGIRKTCLSPRGYEQTVLRKNGDKVTILVHHVVWDAFGNSARDGIRLQIDHIDGDKTNNHIDNLQVLTAKQNRRKSIKRDLPTGVIMHGNKYQAQITKNGKGYFLGLFNTVEEAHQKYLWAEENL